jgi:hypothetical protein
LTGVIPAGCASRPLGWVLADEEDRINWPEAQLAQIEQRRVKRR